jgi:hypothetical protein
MFLSIGFALAACSVSSPGEKSLPATIEVAASAPSVIQVPLSARPTLDGTIDSDEWGQALQFDMTHGGTLYFQHDGEFLYVGISAEGLGFGHVCWQRDDQVWILHSSASLGSAAYQTNETGWRPVRNYDWCCRSTISTVERQELLEREGWMATISYLGHPNQMEYQIAWGGQIQLVVIYQVGRLLDTTYIWPQDLADSCVELALGEGEQIDSAEFNIPTWAYLIMADE